MEDFAIAQRFCKVWIRFGTTGRDLVRDDFRGFGSRSGSGYDGGGLLICLVLLLV